MGAAAFCLLQDSIQHSGNNGQPRQAAPGMPGPNEAIRTTPLIRQLETQIVFVRRVKMTTIAGSTAMRRLV